MPFCYLKYTKYLFIYSKLYSQQSNPTGQEGGQPAGKQVPPAPPPPPQHPQGSLVRCPCGRSQPPPLLTCPHHLSTPHSMQPRGSPTLCRSGPESGSEPVYGSGSDGSRPGPACISGSDGSRSGPVCGSGSEPHTHLSHPPAPPGPSLLLAARRGPLHRPLPLTQLLP